MSDDYDTIVEKTLLHLSYHLPPSLQEDDADLLSSDKLAALPIGRMLRWLAQVARGEEIAQTSQVFPAVRILLATVFWSRTLDVQKIRAFYRDDPLGRMLLRAKWQCVVPADLMTIHEAAKDLHLIPATIWHWVFTDVIEFAQDEMTDRVFLLRVDVERLAANQRTRNAAEQCALEHADNIDYFHDTMPTSKELKQIDE